MASFERECHSDAEMMWEEGSAWQRHRSEGGEGQRRSRGPGRSWPDPVPVRLWGTGREAARHRCRRRAGEATPAPPVGSPGRSIAGGGHGLQQ